MRTWTRNPIPDGLCGGPCGGAMRKGAPMLEIRVPNSTRTKDLVLRRCEHCADEPVPADLPPLAERVPFVPMAHIPTTPESLPFDFKSAQAGREPGEDDE